MYSAESYETKIERAVPLLDKLVPGWWMEGKIDLDTLNLRDARNCVMGQLARAGGVKPSRCMFLDALDHFGMNDTNVFLVGFDVHDATRYAELTQAWSKKIKQLRKERSQPQLKLVPTVMRKRRRTPVAA
jgi:hypothetical protein